MSMPALAFRRNSNVYILSLGRFAFEILESPHKTSGYPVEGTMWRAQTERKRVPAVQPEDDSSPSLDLSAPAGDTPK